MKTELVITVEGTGYPVEISDDGMFRVTLPGVQVKADSFAGLERKARKVKTKFELPFTQLTSAGTRNGTVTGFHAGSGNLLIRWADGETEQISAWSDHGEMMPRLSAVEETEAAQLIAARNTAVHALDVFTRTRKYASLRKAAEAARAQAAEQGEMT